MQPNTVFSPPVWQELSAVQPQLSLPQHGALSLLMMPHVLFS